jgi:hypothetical protein
MKKFEESVKNGLNPSSPTLITAYSQNAANFIYSIERFLYLLFAVLIVFVVVALFDMAGLNVFIGFLSDDEFDFILSILAFITIGITAILLKMIIGARKKLDRWAYAFERNSIGTSISISLSKIGKLELLNAIIENVQDIGKPLQEYMSKNVEAMDRFTNQSISDNVIFDILIDDAKIDKGCDENNHPINMINEYGSIIAKVESTSPILDAKDVQAFIQSILKYIKKTNKFVGLALLIGNEVTNEAMEIAEYYSNKSIGYLIVIEKPIMIDTIY